MDRTSTNRIDENSLTKGQLRKLNALRKSVGDNIGERAFAEWLALQRATGEKPDRNATVIVEALWPFVEEGRLIVPRSGYIVRRGRGRIIVEPASP